MKYRVGIERDLTEYASIEVDAKSAQEAESIIEQQLLRGEIDVDSLQFKQGLDRDLPSVTEATPIKSTETIY